MQTQRVLTGITTTGTPHLGNYAGALRPAIAASQQPGVDAFFFLADYHALIKCDDPERIARSRLEIAATWLAAGLDHERCTFYRQSDIPEIPELCWMLTCLTPKGLMNRAHAYKAAVDANQQTGQEADEGVNMGLYSYPILMAADILLFNAQQVPVGKDQLQHIEMARDLAQRFNHHYAREQAVFVLPQAQVDEVVATLPGLDGRKMSKSYGNTIPLFEGGEAALKAAIAKMKTDSRLPGEPKETTNSHVVALYQAFATPSQTQAFVAALHDGLGWGEAKTQLFQLLNAQLAPMRERYEELMRHPAYIESVLQDGAQKARAVASPMIQTVREALGLRAPQAQVAPSAVKAKKPKWLSFRDEDGQFRARLLAANGQSLLLSLPFSDPKTIGQLCKQAITQGRVQALPDGYHLYVGDTLLGQAPEVLSPAQQVAQVALLQESLLALREE